MKQVICINNKSYRDVLLNVPLEVESESSGLYYIKDSNGFIRAMNKSRFKDVENQTIMKKVKYKGLSFSELTPDKIYDVVKVTEGRIWVKNDLAVTDWYIKKLFEDVQGETRKPIGYKTPIDMYGGTLVKGSLFVKDDPQDHWYLPKGEDRTKTVRGLPKEIVETWEPVYEEEIKWIEVGDPVRKVRLEGDTLFIEGYKEIIPVDNFRALKTWFNSGPFSMGLLQVQGVSVWIGCKEGTRITLEDINKINNLITEKW